MPQQTFGGIVLCGGQSRRMGQPKALLPWQDTTLLQHLLQQFGGICSPVVVATSPDLALPELPPAVIVCCDATAYQGPLSGLVRGLDALPTNVEAACVAACDLPFVTPVILERLMSLWNRQPCEALVMSDAERWQPLLGIYHRSVLPVARELLATGQRRMFDLLDRVHTVAVAPEQWLDIDPDRMGLRNLNSPDDYLAALQRQSATPSPPKGIPADLPAATPAVPKPGTTNP